MDPQKLKELEDLLDVTNRMKAAKEGEAKYAQDTEAADKDYMTRQAMARGADALVGNAGKNVYQGVFSGARDFTSPMQIADLVKRREVAKSAESPQAILDEYRKTKLGQFGREQDQDLEMEKFKRQQDWDVKKIGMQNQADMDKLLAKQAIDAKDPAKQFDRIPEDKKLAVKELATSNAKVAGIARDLDIGVQQLSDPNMSEDQKIAAGQSLLKTINSAYGADAIGAEESKRLGSFLEFKLGNLTGTGSFVGRDVDEFVEQLKNKSEAFKQRLAGNQKQIDEIMGRNSQQGVPSDLAPQSKQVTNNTPSNYSIEDLMAEKARRSQRAR